MALTTEEITNREKSRIVAQIVGDVIPVVATYMLDVEASSYTRFSYDVMNVRTKEIEKFEVTFLKLKNEELFEENMFPDDEQDNTLQGGGDVNGSEESTETVTTETQTENATSESTDENQENQEGATEENGEKESSL